MKLGQRRNNLSTKSNCPSSFQKESRNNFFGKSDQPKPFFNYHPIQTKLTIGQPNDIYEKEADAMADKVVQRQSNHNVVQTKCSSCEKEEKLQKKSDPSPQTASPNIESSLNTSKGSGSPLPNNTRQQMESSFGADFSGVHIHNDNSSVAMNNDLHAQAFTHGSDIYFNSGKYDANSNSGKHLLAHELTHVVQQNPNSDIQCQKSSRIRPYIRKITIHLTPLQSADLEWAGTPPDAPGVDHFTVSTGKGYSNPGDDPGTCLRDCCTDADTQCDAPYNQPGKTGACCTYVGSNFWTGRAVPEHNTWQWWTPVQPYYSKRGIALHQHTEVTGHPIGHGCVRMDEPNAKRIFDYSVIGSTRVEIEGRASPVECNDDRKCAKQSSLQQGDSTLQETSPQEQREGIAT